MAVNFDRVRANSNKLFVDPFQTNLVTLAFLKSFKKVFDAKTLKLGGELVFEPSELRGSHEILLKGKDAQIKQSFSEDGALSYNFGLKPSFMRPWGLFGLVSQTCQEVGIKYSNKYISGSLQVNNSSALGLNLLGKYKSIAYGLMTEFSVPSRSPIRYDACIRYKHKGTEVLLVHNTPETIGGIGQVDFSVMKTLKSMDNSKLGVIVSSGERYKADVVFSRKLKEFGGKINVKAGTYLGAYINFQFKAAKNVTIGVTCMPSFVYTLPYDLGVHLTIK